MVAERQLLQLMEELKESWMSVYDWYQRDGCVLVSPLLRDIASQINLLRLVGEKTDFEGSENVGKVITENETFSPALLHKLFWEFE